MSFVDLDRAAVARGLCLISDRPDDLVDVFFERHEEVEVPASGETPGVRAWREEGLAVRLVRDRRQWLAVQDDVSPEAFADAVRRVARGLTQGVLRKPRITVRGWGPVEIEEDQESFAARVEAALRARRMVFPMRHRLRRHRRWVRVVDRTLAADAECESFFSCRIETRWGRWGALLPDLDASAVSFVTEALAASFRARSSAPPSPSTTHLMLGPSAAAVFLHEAVGHALEVDTLALGGHPEAAVGLKLGSEVLDLLDDPTSGPEGLRRRTDDEGAPVLRRWLLRSGVVEQPLADRAWARGSATLMSGAARRQSRRLGPVPRSLHLELLAGQSSTTELAAQPEAGVFASEASRGRLDAETGEFFLEMPHGRLLANGQLGARVGPFGVRGRVGDLLEKIRGVGQQPAFGGAGWCAKGGRRMPVWSTTPALLIEGVEVVS